MCGFAGILSTNPEAHQHHMLRKMAASLHHRGPDDTGIWSDKEAGISLCHKRLAILDLSAAGHQPMHSRSGRYVIAYNGEIYNHLEIRNELQKRKQNPNWKGHSDTETLLAGIQAWGLEETLQISVGMFAFALWDRKKRSLTLGRDRMGEKPLYYGWNKNNLFFASELKAMKQHPDFEAQINRKILPLYLRFDCIPTPFSIYEGIYKLEPGKTITLNFNNKSPEAEPYWSLDKYIATTPTYAGSEEEAVNDLELLLGKSIGRQMLSDVPLGAFLSGGIDSSTIVALMQSRSDKPIKTYTIGFNEKEYNEADQAKAIAKHLGTDHTETIISPDDALKIIPHLPTLYDEPFSDPSQIPTYLVSKTTRDHVTVALSGDAGDELFGGYNRYFWTDKIWNKISGLPLILRQLGAKALTLLSPTTWTQLFKIISLFLPQRFQIALPGHKIYKLSEILNATNPQEIYWKLLSNWKQPEAVVRDSAELCTLVNLNHINTDFVHQMMYQDTHLYLPDDILTKVDRAAMGVSLETRIPFLDHNIVQFAWSLPLHYKIRNNQGKWILREILKKYIPQKLFDRPKMGFGIPIDSWLRGPLKDWAENLLSETRLQNEGFFNPEPILKKWSQHQSGKFDWQYHLWTILMFQSWYEKERSHA